MSGISALFGSFPTEILEIGDYFQKFCPELPAISGPDIIQQTVWSENIYESVTLRLHTCEMTHLYTQDRMGLWKCGILILPSSLIYMCAKFLDSYVCRVSWFICVPSSCAMTHSHTNFWSFSIYMYICTYGRVCVYIWSCLWILWDPKYSYVSRVNCIRVTWLIYVHRVGRICEGVGPQDCRVSAFVAPESCWCVCVLCSVWRGVLQCVPVCCSVV